MSLKVLIVDDQAFCIEQLSRVVLDQAPQADIQVARSPDDALTRLGALHPDLIVVELSLPGLDGETGVRRLSASSDAAVLVMDARHNPVAARACLAAGAAGYVTRSSTRELVSAAVAVVLAGGRYFPEAAAEASAPPAQGLSPRQREVLDGLTQGLTNLEIGQRLGIALPTVKLHVRAVLKALGARNRTEAAMRGRALPATT